MEQFNTLTGPIKVEADGWAVNGVFDQELPAHIAVSRSAEGRVVGTVFERGPLRVGGRPQAGAPALQLNFGAARRCCRPAALRLLCQLLQAGRACGRKQMR